MANLVGNIIAGAVSGGAKENIQTLREEAEQKRRESYAKLLNEFGRDNIKLSNDLSMKRDEVNRTNTKEDEFDRYVRDRSAKSADYQKERTDKLSDEDRRFSQEKGLIGYRAGVSKANSIVGYSEDGVPLTFADVKTGTKVYADALGREKLSPKSVEMAKWEYLQQNGTPEERKKAAGGFISPSDTGRDEVKPGQALKEIASIDMQIGNLRKGNMLTEDGMEGILAKMPELAPFINSKAEMSPQDKQKVEASLNQYKNYLQQFLPAGKSGIMTQSPQVDEVGADIKSLLGK